jgi:hypothetical protein
VTRREFGHAAYVAPNSRAGPLPNSNAANALRTTRFAASSRSARIPRVGRLVRRGLCQRRSYLWCRLSRRASLHLRLNRVGRAPAPCNSGSSRNLRGYESASTGITLSYVDQNLCRRLMPRPKFGRSRPTAAAASPATFRLVDLQVIRREQMAIAADMRYGHGLEHTFQGKADHVSFGCSKARPRYDLRRIAPSRNGLPHWAPLFAGRFF